MTLPTLASSGAAPCAAGGGAVAAAGSMLLGAVALVACAMVLASASPSLAAVPLLVAPILEETIFRAGLQDALLRKRCAPRYANVATASVFVVAHCVGRGVEFVSLAVFVPALALGWTYGRYRSLRVCVALHMLMNIVWFEYSRLAMPWLRAL